MVLSRAVDVDISHSGASLVAALGLDSCGMGISWAVIGTVVMARNRIQRHTARVSGTLVAASYRHIHLLVGLLCEHHSLGSSDDFTYSACHSAGVQRQGG